MEKLKVILKSPDIMNEVFAFDKPIRLKKKASKDIAEALVTAVDGKVVLTGARYNRFKGKNWLLREIFFAIVSVFGLFDYRFGKGYYDAYFEVEVPVGENTEIELRTLAPRADGKVFAIKSNTEVVEKANVYKADKVSKKRKKALTFIKIALLAVAVIVTVLALA